MEQLTRIELAPSAWKADVLPLNYSCIVRRVSTFVYFRPPSAGGFHRISTLPPQALLCKSQGHSYFTPWLPVRILLTAWRRPSHPQLPLRLGALVDTSAVSCRPLCRNRTGCRFHSTYVANHINKRIYGVGAFICCQLTSGLFHCVLLSTICANGWSGRFSFLQTYTYQKLFHIVEEGFKVFEFLLR